MFFAVSRKARVLAAFFLIVIHLGAGYEWPAIEESVAYQRYLKRKPTELSKLIYLMDRFNFQGMEIRVDGTTFQAPLCVPYVKAYLALQYRGERAEVWLQKHVYRSPFTHKVMYGRLPGEDFRIGRDMLFSELAKLRSLEEVAEKPRS